MAAPNPVEGEPSLQRNRSEVVAEVRAAFERYEAALVSRDLDVLAASFDDDACVLRFGIADCQRGPAELARWRAAQPSLPLGRTLSQTEITTFGTRLAVVTTLFSYPGRRTVGRQSQTWVRHDRWVIVHAHVSEVDEE